MNIEEAKLYLEHTSKDDEIERLTISLQAQEELTMNEHIKVERLNNIINELENYIRARVADNNSCSVCSVMTDDLLNILKGVDIND